MNFSSSQMCQNRVFMIFAFTTYILVLSQYPTIIQAFDSQNQPEKLPRRSQPTLRMTPENHLQIRPHTPFKIALFADLHFGENSWTDWGPRQDVNTLRVMSNVLDDESADFVVYLGDVITANNIIIGNASLYWDQATFPARARGIPWASIFGNHDDTPFQWPLDWFSETGIPQLRCTMANSSCLGEENCSFKGTRRLELMKNEMENNALSYSKDGPRDLWPSVSNYFLQVSSSNNPKSPVAFLYFLDSGGGSYPEVISNAQAEWFNHVSNKINPDLRCTGTSYLLQTPRILNTILSYGTRVPELIFWHIPSKAYKRVAPKFGIHNHCVGSINKEKVAAQEGEMGIMKLIVKRPSVKAVFVGHNHGLDWCCPYKKLWLCYARHTGYGGYGNWPRGARILEITETPFSLKTWIRMEDGSVHSEVVMG